MAKKDKKNKNTAAPKEPAVQPETEVKAAPKPSRKGGEPVYTYVVLDPGFARVDGKTGEIVNYSPGTKLEMTEAEALFGVESAFTLERVPIKP